MIIYVSTSSATMSGEFSEKLKSQYILYIVIISYLAAVILCGTVLNIVALKTALKVGIIRPIQLTMLTYILIEFHILK